MPLPTRLFTLRRRADPLALRAPLLALSIALGLSVSSAAAARDYPSQTIGDWTVSVSKDAKGCFLTQQYDRPGGTTLLLGLDLDGTNHLSVLNANWSIKPKDRLKLSFRLSKGAYPDHFAVGMATGDKQGFVTSFEEKFPGYFAASTTLQITRGNVPVEQLSLAGSGAAVAELRRCLWIRRQDAVAPAGGEEGSTGIPRDPFASNAEKKSGK